MKFLAELQSLDGIIRRLEEEKNTVPLEISELRRKIDGIQEESVKLESELEESRKERRKKEREVEEKIEVLDKYRSQKNQVKTNDAYSALLKEIQDVEGEKTELEESILIFMERGEELSGLLEKKKSILARSGEELSHLEEEDRKRIAELEKELSRCLEQRGSTALKVDASLLPLYERIRKAKDGLAFVLVKGGTCQGCFMELPPQMVNELMKGDKIVTCERCSRLLYWEGE